MPQFVQNVEHLIHKKSKVVNNGVPKAPLATAIELGEITINYAKDHETMFIKNESGDVVSFLNGNAVPAKAAVKKFTSGTDSGKTFVYFYSAGQATTQVDSYLFRYDATDFVIDGMIDTVQVTTITSGSSQVDVLEFVFNTDSGKQTIDIPLTELFNPANLSSDTTSTDGSYVSVRVVQTAGKISEVHVNDSGVTNSFGNISGDCTGSGDYVSVKTSQSNGKITAITVNDSGVTNSFANISGTCSGDGSHHLVSVSTSQSNGKVTSITVDDSGAYNNLSGLSEDIDTINNKFGTGITTSRTVTDRLQYIGDALGSGVTDTDSATSQFELINSKLGTGVTPTSTVTDRLQYIGDALGSGVTDTDSATSQFELINGKLGTGVTTSKTVTDRFVEISSGAVTKVSSSGSTINVSSGQNTDWGVFYNVETNGNISPISGFSHDPSNATSAYTNTSAVTSSSGYPSIISGATIDTVKINTALQQLEKAIVDIWKLLGKNTFDKDAYGKTLYQIITENERVTSAALNDLNNRLMVLENS